MCCKRPKKRFKVECYEPDPRQPKPYGQEPRSGIVIAGSSELTKNLNVLKTNKSPEAVSSSLHVLNAYTKNINAIEKNILERKVAELVHQYNRLKEENIKKEARLVESSLLRQGVAQIKEKDTSVDELEQFNLLASKLRDVREKTHWAAEERKRMLMVREISEGNVNSNVTWNEKLKKLDRNYDLVIASEKKRLLKAKFIINQLQTTLADFADINSKSKLSHLKLVEEIGSIDKRAGHLKGVFSQFDSVVLEGSLEKEEMKETLESNRMNKELDISPSKKVLISQETNETTGRSRVEEDILVMQNYLRFVERTGVMKDGLNEAKYLKFLQKKKENAELKEQLSLLRFAQELLTEKRQRLKNRVAKAHESPKRDGPSHMTEESYEQAILASKGQSKRLARTGNELIRHLQVNIQGIHVFNSLFVLVKAPGKPLSVDHCFIQPTKIHLRGLVARFGEQQVKALLDGTLKANMLVRLVEEDKDSGSGRI